VVKVARYSAIATSIYATLKPCRVGELRNPVTSLVVDACWETPTTGLRRNGKSGKTQRDRNRFAPHTLGELGMRNPVTWLVVGACWWNPTTGLREMVKYSAIAILICAT
jgi:hypothetical protein